MEYKALALVAAILLAATTIDSVQQNNEFSLFQAKFGKVYRSETEEAYRNAVFLQNVAKIALHNADKTQTYRMAVNQFADMTHEEFVGTMLMNVEAPKGIVKDDTTPRVVKDVNWVTEGAVQAVKDQGRCGSCWAFAATGVAESFKYLETGELGLFSDQQVTSCDPLSSGCNGGWHYWAIDYMSENGICTQESYPYTSGTFGITGDCLDSTCTKDSYNVGSSVDVSGLSGLFNQLNSSPVSVAVDATFWSFYFDGIFSFCGTGLNHAVLAVGYTDEYTLIKNSWGEFWGESGYIRLAPGNTCGVSEVCFVPAALPF